MTGLLKKTPVAVGAIILVLICVIGFSIFSHLRNKRYEFLKIIDPSLSMLEEPQELLKCAIGEMHLIYNSQGQVRQYVNERIRHDALVTLLSVQKKHFGVDPKSVSDNKARRKTDSPSYVRVLSNGDGKDDSNAIILITCPNPKPSKYETINSNIRNLPYWDGEMLTFRRDGKLLKRQTTIDNER